MKAAEGELLFTWKLKRSLKKLTTRRAGKTKNPTRPSNKDTAHCNILSAEMIKSPKAKLTKQDKGTQFFKTTAETQASEQKTKGKPHPMQHVMQCLALFRDQIEILDCRSDAERNEFCSHQALLHFGLQNLVTLHPSPLRRRRRHRRRRRRRRWRLALAFGVGVWRWRLAFGVGVGVGVGVGRWRWRWRLGVGVGVGVWRWRWRWRWRWTLAWRGVVTLKKGRPREGGTRRKRTSSKEGALIRGRGTRLPGPHEGGHGRESLPEVAREGRGPWEEGLPEEGPRKDGPLDVEGSTGGWGWRGREERTRVWREDKRIATCDVRCWHLCFCFVLKFTCAPRTEKFFNSMLWLFFLLYFKGIKSIQSKEADPST